VRGAERQGSRSQEGVGRSKDYLEEEGQEEDMLALSFDQGIDSSESKNREERHPQFRTVDVARHPWDVSGVWPGRRRCCIGPADLPIWPRWAPSWGQLRPAGPTGCWYETGDLLGLDTFEGSGVWFVGAPRWQPD
jgi:hypothetical protein